ncbi:MAG: GUN4 domain-containing protein [Scytonema sp. PMC 1069.18]|nr:GUN4 domain-containing protein [Scytonema sp. PMC 1069.18]
MPNPQQRKQVRDAFISAFTDKSSLERMLYFELDKNLNQITQDSNLEVIVFELIRTAETQGWFEKLIIAAINSNSGNPLLQAIATELQTDNATTTPYNSSKEEAIAEYRKKVEEFLADDHEISLVESEILKDLQEKLKLTEEQVRAIRNEVLKPFGIYQENLDKYRQVFTKLVDERGYPLSQKDKADLKKLQEYYQLQDEDIALLFEEAEQQQSAPSDDLSSDRNVDYTRLRDFLKAGQWKEADYETYLVMLQVVGREKGDWISDEELLSFPCTDLRTIDHLWVKYSNGRFGFSVQKQIYLDVGGIPDGKYYEEAWKKFGDRVGWRVKESWIFGYSDATYDTTAPVGHLPGHLPVRVKRAGDV